MRLRDKLIDTYDELDRLKERGEWSFEREPDMERDLLNADGCGNAIAARAEATLDAANAVEFSHPRNIVMSAIAEGIVIGYHLHRAYGESLDREVVEFEP